MAQVSAERLMTQFEMTTSKDASGSGMCSISPFKNSTFMNPRLPLVLIGEGQHLGSHVESVWIPEPAILRDGSEDHGRRSWQQLRPAPSLIAGFFINLSVSATVFKSSSRVYR
jgi:hypothetical protein